MRKVDFKPLLLILPCLIILMMLPWIEILSSDIRGNEPGDSAASQQEASIDNTNQAGIDDTNPKDEASEPDTSDSPGKSYAEKDDMKIPIVIGTVGSVDKGGYAPIFSEPDNASEVMAKLQYNCAVVLMDEQLEDEWYYVSLPGKDTDGYVSKDGCRPFVLSIGSLDPVRDQIVKDAFSYLGLSFKRYGKSLEEGIDCSNFIQQIYARNDIKVPNTPVKLRDCGTQVDETDAWPGDIVFYDKANDGYGHVAIYLGHGMMINSSGHSGKTYPEGGVRICCLQYKDRTSYQIYDLLDDNDGGDDE